MLRIQHPNEIDVELIANHLGLLVRRRDLKHEEGRLLRAGVTGIIVVARSAFSSAKWRFVVAHEIGHFLRHAGFDDFAICTDGNLRDYLGSGREAEANDFASELLMPTALFSERCERSRPSLRNVDELASEFRTSLTATALRFVRFSPEPCAVVHSSGGVVEWMSWSADFKIGIKKGTRLTTRTYAGDLFAGNHTDDRLQQVDGDAWSDSSWASSIDLFEHSRKVARNAVLTFLWHEYR
jgi:hypothetical protein